MDQQCHREQRHAEDDEQDEADQHGATGARLGIRRGPGRHRMRRRWDGSRLATVVDRQRLLGRLAERLAVGADEATDEDRRGQRVEGLGLDRLEIPLGHARGTGDLLEGDASPLTQIPEIGAD